MTRLREGRVGESIIETAPNPLVLVLSPHSSWMAAQVGPRRTLSRPSDLPLDPATNLATKHCSKAPLSLLLNAEEDMGIDKGVRNVQDPRFPFSSKKMPKMNYIYSTICTPHLPAF